MKRLLILFIVLIVLTACSVNGKENTDLLYLKREEGSGLSNHEEGINFYIVESMFNDFAWNFGKKFLEVNKDDVLDEIYLLDKHIKEGETSNQYFYTFRAKYNNAYSKNGKFHVSEDVYETLDAKENLDWKLIDKYSFMIDDIDFVNVFYEPKEIDRNEIIEFLLEEEYLLFELEEKGIKTNKKDLEKFVFSDYENGDAPIEFMIKAAVIKTIARNK